MKRVFLLFSCLLLSMGFAVAQDRQASGIVVDETGEPVAGASVTLKGGSLSIGTVTDTEGRFSLSVPAGAKTLAVKYIGYLAAEVAAEANVTVKLNPDVKTLGEVVVVGYGTQQKKDVTSSIVKVSGSDISNLSAPSFESQLAGRAAGVNVVTQNGMVGEAPEFQIRGYSTLSSGSQPLVVIDGIPINSGQIQQLYGRYNPLSDINPGDIQSIEILKDGAATAVYGSRAANGVVLITTKRGSKSAAKVTYDAYAGFASPVKLHELLNAEEFVTISNEKFTNWGSEGPAVLDPAGVDTDWNDYVYRTGFQQNHTVSASGGTDKSTYYTSLGYSNMEGIIRASSQQRFNVTANVTQQANKWLTIGANVQANRTILEGVMNEENSLGSMGFASVRMLPNVSVFNAEDKTGYNIDAVNRKTLGRGANRTYIDNGIQNIVWAMDNNVNRSKSTRIIGGGFGEIKFTDGLTLRTHGGMDLTWLNDYMTWDPESGDGLGYNGLLEEVNTTYYNWNWQNVLNFNRSFGVHNVSATAVQEYTYSEYAYTDASVTELSDPFFTDHIISNTFVTPDIGGYKTFNGLASYLFRLNYNYDSKYYLGGSIRRDGLSKLHEDVRWGTFYGASGAYRISRESFWTASGLESVLNDLRIRASIATVGNSDLGTNNFPYINTYGAKKYGNEAGVGWTNFGNNRLKWESSTTGDLGLDGSLLNGRLAFELTWFQKNTNDLIQEVPTPPSFGIPYNRYYDNVGSIKNSGVEIALSGTVVNRAFKWESGFNVSFVKNRVIKLLNGEDIIDNYTIIREGESFMALYGYDYYGVNRANGNPIWRKGDGSLVQFDTFGEYDYAVYDPENPEDVSVPATLSAVTDKKILGNSLPTWFGGFNNTITYRDFDLNIFLRFSGGNKIMNATRQSSLLSLYFNNNGKEILGRWQSPENPGDGLTPKIGYGDESPLYNDGYTDSHFVEDGAYLRLANLALGYNVPASFTSKLDVAKIRFYVQAQNLLTLTGYSGLDPETSTRRGVDWDGMPQQKVFTLGVNVTF